jgi:hypothetical protein
VRAPIGWADGPNVIGVTATDENRRILDSSDRSKRFVQLLAPGAKVLSLAKSGAYAKASGASQAAPQVAAAAALLMARGKSIPAHIKARLVATADWHHDYEDKVWGGFLNVTRAVMHLEANILTRLSQSGSKSVSFHSDDRLLLQRSVRYPADGPTPNGSENGGEVPWSKVLRIARQTWLPEGHRDRDLYRMVYVNGEQVEIRKNVEFKPGQKFGLKACADPGRDEPDQVTCPTLIPEQIDDYVAAFPPQKQKLRFSRGIE